MTSTPTSLFPGNNRITPREALLSAVALVVFLEVIKELARAAGGYPAQALYTSAAVAQLYYPIWRLGKLGAPDPEAELGLRDPVWSREVPMVLTVCAITFIPFAIGHHFFWTRVFHYRFVPGLPPDVATLVLTHFLGVALPEETFYRGFVQPRLLFAKRYRIFGADVGWEIPVTSALFALGHFAGEYDPTRLGPFFPGLVFGWMRARTGGIWGAITYHALSNIVSAFLFACYRA